MSLRLGLLFLSFVGMLNCAVSFHPISFFLRNFHRQSFARRALTTMSVSSEGASGIDANTTAASEQPRIPQKQHTLTVCMVPPFSAANVWTDVTKARRQLKDPGFFRWPPHANLLYPFIEIKNDLHDIVLKLRNATRQCPAFQVSLDSLGTFGGKNRGVLWLYPRSYRREDDKMDADEEPLVQLQAVLEQEFPMCSDQRKSGRFTPHMTLSHFPSLEEAQKSQSQVEEWWPDNVTFNVNEIYLLQRKGDDGQFLRAATVALGNDSTAINDGITIHDPPEPFPDMPFAEEDWVREERMELKKRRNASWKGQRRRRGGKQRGSRGPSKSKDTPEIIAAKRAARKEKRERLERERLEKESRSSDGSL